MVLNSDIFNNKKQAKQVGVFKKSKVVVSNKK